MEAGAANKPQPSSSASLPVPEARTAGKRKPPKPLTPGLQECIDHYVALCLERLKSEHNVTGADAKQLKRVLSTGSPPGEVMAVLDYYLGNPEYQWCDWALGTFASRYSGIRAKAEKAKRGGKRKSSDSEELPMDRYSPRSGGW